MEKLELSSFSGGDIKWFSHSGKVEKCLGVSQKVKYGITMQPNNSKYNLKRIKNRHSDTASHMGLIPGSGRCPGGGNGNSL